MQKLSLVIGSVALGLIAAIAAVVFKKNRKKCPICNHQDMVKIAKYPWKGMSSGGVVETYQCGNCTVRLQLSQNVWSGIGPAE